MFSIRVSKIIRKNDLELYIKNPEISKVSIVRRKNNLRNPDLLKVDIFIVVERQAFFNMIGRANFIGKTTTIGNGVNCFLNGIGNAKKCGFMTSTDINKLKTIETTYNLNFSIPNHYFDLINKYK